VKKYKATAISPANIAFIKYWGWQNRDKKKLLIPTNDSISMNLSNCLTTTTVEFSPFFIKDSVKIAYFQDKEAKNISETPLKKIISHVDRLRKIKKIDYPVKIVSRNAFPANSGIASSASAFSALTLALSKALGLGWELDKKKLSTQTRLSGSGSACRSIVDGFAYWQKGHSSETSYAYQLQKENHWSLVDIVVIVSTKNKEKSSREGHGLATTSPYYKARLTELPERVEKVKQAILQKKFKKIGTLIEQEAISMHSICMTSNPPIFYFTPGTLEIIQALRAWRKEGLFGYFTIDAGPNVHVICLEKDAQTINSKLKKLRSTLFTIVNRPCKGTQLTDKHLF